jgi:protein transport protein SEC24
MMVVSDLAEPFLPTPEDLLVNLRECREPIYELLDKLPEMFKATQNPDIAFGPALLSAYKIIKNLGGKIITFLRSVDRGGGGKKLLFSTLLLSVLLFASAVRFRLLAKANW